jgi:protein ImuB
VTALRRCRHPVPARVAVGPDQRPVRVTTDRRSFAGGRVTACAGPWRTSGEWWEMGTPGLAEARTRKPASEGGWDRDEWDVSLNDGAVYRIFRDRFSDAWFVEAIVD